MRLWWSHLNFLFSLKSQYSSYSYEEFIFLLRFYAIIFLFYVLCFFFEWAHIVFFCLVCFTCVLFFASSQTINLFFFSFFFPSHSRHFLCGNFLLWRGKKTTMTRTDVKRCLKHKILFLLHMLSFFLLECLLSARLILRSISNRYTKQQNVSSSDKVVNIERNFYQIIIFVLSLMIAGVANGNCARQIHMLMVRISLFAPLFFHLSFISFSFKYEHRPRLDYIFIWCVYRLIQWTILYQMRSDHLMQIYGAPKAFNHFLSTKQMQSGLCFLSYFFKHFGSCKRWFLKKFSQNSSTLKINIISSLYKKKPTTTNSHLCLTWSVSLPFLSQTNNYAYWTIS